MYNGVGVKGMVQYKIFIYRRALDWLASCPLTILYVIIIIICNQISTMYVLYSYKVRRPVHGRYIFGEYISWHFVPWLICHLSCIAVFDASILTH